MTDVGKGRRRSRISRTQPSGRREASFELTEGDAATQQDHFGVARDQIEHDFVISHVLAAISQVADRVVFYGGTALSRTIVDGLRLSEDIDLLTVGNRKDVAPLLDETIRRTLERGFGPINANPWLADSKTDTHASIFTIGTVDVQVQLIDGRYRTNWPIQISRISQRYHGIPAIELTTLTAAGFVGAKTVAWSDLTRNAPRDLYDLWALARAGHINAEAAAIYKRFGATGAYPDRSTLPGRAPTRREWDDALGHQCQPQIDPDQAHEQVLEAWDRAVRQAAN